MKKQIKVSGYVELEEHQDFPKIGSKVHLADVVAEVDGDHTDRRKRRGGKVTLEQTAPATIESATLLKIEAPVDNQATLEDITEPGED